MAEGRCRTPREWGNLVRAASPHRGPRPRVSVWHGGADATVMPMNADESLKQWADVHRLGVAPTLTNKVKGYPHRVWRDATSEDLVDAYTIPDMAHGVPVEPGSRESQCGAAAPFALDVGISSTYPIAKFWRLTRQGFAASEGPDRHSTASCQSAQVADPG
jgi:feruloyl esterase